MQRVASGVGQRRSGSVRPAPAPRRQGSRRRMSPITPSVEAAVHLRPASTFFPPDPAIRLPRLPGDIRSPIAAEWTRLTRLLGWSGNSLPAALHLPGVLTNPLQDRLAHIGGHA